MHKNWKEICKIGKTDWCLMMALAHANNESPNGRRLVKAFPKCFSEKKAAGPIPMSLLQEKAEKNNRTGPHGSAGGLYEAPEYMLCDLGVLDDFHIPYTKFHKRDEGQNNQGLPTLPVEIENQCTFGNRINFHGHDYIVVEECEPICLAPADFISVDL